MEMALVADQISARSEAEARSFDSYLPADGVVTQAEYCILQSTGLEARHEENFNHPTDFRLS